MTTEEIRAELNMRRGLRAEVVETLVKFDKSIEELEVQLALMEDRLEYEAKYGNVTFVLRCRPKHNPNEIHMQLFDRAVGITIDQAEQLSLALRQIIATAKRKAGA
jgi:hypothetical protein